MFVKHSKHSHCVLRTLQQLCDGVTIISCLKFKDFSNNFLKRTTALAEDGKLKISRNPSAKHTSHHSQDKHFQVKQLALVLKQFLGINYSLQQTPLKQHKNAM